MARRETTRNTVPPPPIALSAALLSGALSKLGGAVLVLDRELMVRAGSREAEALLGTPIVLGMRGVDVLCGDRLDRPVAQSLARGEAVTSTVVRPRVDGIWGHVLSLLAELGPFRLDHE